ncbi:MAG: hypothetical protein DBX47_00645 [Clostridiales bacterium]|nr:MAG: hypothetical protein DBX47_00645 [Clostridiales bacterium]
MDVYYEQLYKRRKRPQDAVLQVSLLILTLLVAAASLIWLRVWLMTLVGPFLAALISVAVTGAALYFGYRVYMQFDLEYEYSYLNGDIDIDKIMNKTMRKRIISVNAKNFNRFGIYDENAKVSLKNMQFDTTVNVCSYTESTVYYAVLRHPSQGNTLLIFEPEERILEDLKKYTKNLSK